MLPLQIPKINPDEFSRCEERELVTDHGKSLGPIQKTDLALKEAVYQALWKDDVLRAMEYDQIDVHVKNGIVHLTGHIMSASSQNRVENAIRTVPEILDFKNDLVLDDKLTLEVAASLGKLESIYDCKFFTGVSHGVVSLNGTGSNAYVKLQAEKCAASNPNVRGVINNVHALGAEMGKQNQPFLQPAIGEIIYFLDGIFGTVKQVIINPNNRRVIAMTVQGKFTDPRYELNPLTYGKTRLTEQVVTVPMNVVRYLTKVSGFLFIRSNERNRYLDFDPAGFITPRKDWVPPYPYCFEDVIFPIEYMNADAQDALEPQEFPFGPTVEDASIREQFFATDSLGL